MTFNLRVDLSDRLYTLGNRIAAAMEADSQGQNLDEIKTLIVTTGEKIMAKAEELTAALDRVVTEVGETADQVKVLRDEIAALKTQVGDTDALNAAIDAAVTRAGGIADSLDALQDHPAPPEA